WPRFGSPPPPARVTALDAHALRVTQSRSQTPQPQPPLAWPQPHPQVAQPPDRRRPRRAAKDDPPLLREQLRNLLDQDDPEQPAEQPGPHRERVRACHARPEAKLGHEPDPAVRGIDAKAL